MISIFIALAIIGGIFYRMGGSAKFNTLYRDLGVPAVFIGAMVYLGLWNWTAIISAILLFGSLTTYFGFINKWYGHDEQEWWLNWMLVGIAYSFAALPSVIYLGAWEGFFIRTIVLPIIFIGIDYIGDFLPLSNDKSVVKEFIRGFATIVTLPLLAI